MATDNLKKLATGSVLFNLSRIISPRLVTILYFLGLAAILLWAVNHFFHSFRFGFGNGLWGLLEIAVFGLFAFVVLRIACEAVIVFFKAHASEAAEATRPRPSTSLIDEVRGAIEELAEEEEDEVIVTPPPPPPARPAPPPPAPPAASPTPEGTITPATTPGVAADGLPPFEPKKPD